MITAWCAAQKKGYRGGVSIPGARSKGTGNTGLADLLVAAPTRGVIEVGALERKSGR